MVTHPATTAMMMSLFVFVLLGGRDWEWEDRSLLSAHHSDSPGDKKGKEGGQGGEGEGRSG